MPARYGPCTTLHDRLVRWRRDGTWERLLAYAQTRRDAVGGAGVDRQRGCHGQPGASACRGGRTTACQGRATGKGGRQAAQNEALGRSRGGLTTKLHVACDGRDRPLSTVVTEGNGMRAPSWGGCWPACCGGWMTDEQRP